MTLHAPEWLHLSETDLACNPLSVYRHKGDTEALAIMTNATLRHLYEEEDATQQSINMTYSLRL